MNETITTTRRTIGAIALTATAICLLVYVRALSCDFINFDDPYYVMENPGIRILDRQFFLESFTTSYLGWWMPLTWLSYAIDYHFWGLNPFGYHLTNILLHAMNSGLVVLIADLVLKRWRVADLCPTKVGSQASTTNDWIYPMTLLLAAVLWGAHPLRVESVAWVTERKDVLNGFFSLGSVMAYLIYADRRDAGRAAAHFYISSLLLFLLSLMAKPVSVVIPAMLLVMDWYPLKRISRDNFLKICAEKLPFIVISISMVLATLNLANSETILVSFQDFPIHRRFILAGDSLLEYLRLTVFPAGLAIIYLLPREFPTEYYLAAASILAFCCFCCFCWKRFPWLVSTWLLFMLPLIPVLGFFQNGSQAHADRFTYLPGVALSIACAGLVRASIYRYQGLARYGIIGFSILLTLLYASVTVQLTGVWKNSETLWSRVIAVQPAGRAYYLRADYRQQTGRYLEAAEDLAISIQMGREAGFPGVFNLHALRGDALSRAGRYLDAVAEFSEAIRLNPDDTYFYHRGVALGALGRSTEAEKDFKRAGDATGPIVWRLF